MLEAGSNLSEDDGSLRNPQDWLAGSDRLRCRGIASGVGANVPRSWRLQREFFWDEEMSGVRWQEVAGAISPAVGSGGITGGVVGLPAIWEMQVSSVLHMPTNTEEIILPSDVIN